MIQKHGGKTQIVFIDKQEKIQEELQPVVPDPASTSQQRSPSSPQTKHRSPNTLMFVSKTNSNSLQYAKFQPLDLWDEGSIYRYL